MRQFDLWLPVAANILAGWLVAILFRRKLHVKYPFFFGYLLFSLVATFALLSVFNNAWAYFMMYFAFEVHYALLSVLVLHEVFRHVFLPFYRFHSWFWLLFPGAAGAVLLLSVWQTILHTPAESSPLYGVFLSFSITVNYVRVGLFGLFFLLVTLLGRRGAHYSFGIIQGFAAMALGELFSFGLRYEFGTRYATLLRYGPPVAFLCALVLWLNAFLRPLNSETGSLLRVTPGHSSVPATPFARLKDFLSKPFNSLPGRLPQGLEVNFPKPFNKTAGHAHQPKSRWRARTVL